MSIPSLYVCLYASEHYPQAADEIWIVQNLPDWFPGTRFKVLAKEVHEKYRISIEGPVEYVKGLMKVSP